MSLAAVAELEALSKEALIERFESLYGCAIPKRMRREMILQAVAYRMQGGCDSALRRRLEKLTAELHRTGRIATLMRPPVKPGTRLLREWQGETHSVTVMENGFLYRDGQYRSLSEIARAITGTRWSGPAFFGLKGMDS